MAISPDYTHNNVLKKVNIGNNDYYLKDEDLRDTVEAFGGAVYCDAASSLDPTGTDVPTEKATADYVGDQITTLTETVINPKVSVRTGLDEELIFDYIPASNVQVG